MLTNTFVHLPGVGEKTEQRLWTRGVHTWADALLASGTSKSWRELLEESVRRLSLRDAGWFAPMLPSNQQWRLYRDFQNRCAYLDIETTGMGPGASVTTVAVYDGSTLRTYVRGRNLDRLRSDLAAFSLVVTFNGKSFDGPFLARDLGIELPTAHLDLMHVLRGLGLTGGLKRIERNLGIRRPGLQDIDGEAAVMLWYEYVRRGNERALETLLAYNAHDVVNLHLLAVHAHNEHVMRTPLGARGRLPAPTLPTIPFHPDPATLARLPRGWFASG